MMANKQSAAVVVAAKLWGAARQNYLLMMPDLAGAHNELQMLNAEDALVNALNALDADEQARKEMNDDD